MKIYEKVVLDMTQDHLPVIEEVSFKYEGDVAECKGGGGGSSSSVDTAYNSRLASIYETQTEWGQGFYDFWQRNNAGYEAAKIDANMGLIPHQTQLQKEQISSERQLLPGQTQLGLSQIKAAQDILPGQTAAAQSANKLATARNTASLGLLPQQTDVTRQYLKQAHSGVDINDRMGKAAATMAHRYKDAGNILTRQMGRMGNSPSSGKLVAAMNDLNMNKARGIALAQEQARASAESENFNRLQGAAGLGLPR